MIVVIINVLKKELLQTVISINITAAKPQPEKNTVNIICLNQSALTFTSRGLAARKVPFTSLLPNVTRR